MKIDLENYQSWLLLYIDNELSAAEKKRVEELLQKNPEVRAELDALNRTLQIPDPSVQFPVKIGLLKQAGNSATINFYNQESYFLRYADNELTKEEQDVVEAYAADHEGFLKELESMKAFRMAPDLTVCHPDKNELYRQNRNTPLFKIIRWSMAAAACLLIAFSFQLFNVGRQQQTPDTSSANSKHPQTNLSGSPTTGAEEKIRVKAVASVQKSHLPNNKPDLLIALATANPSPLILDARSAEDPYKTTALAYAESISPAIEAQNPTLESTTPKIAPDISFNEGRSIATTTASESTPVELTAEPIDIAWEEEQEEMTSQRNPKLKILLRKLNRAAEKIGYRNTEREQDRQVVRIAYMEIGLK